MSGINESSQLTPRLQIFCFHFHCHSRIILLLSCFQDLHLFLFLEVLIHVGFSYLSVLGLANFHNSKFLSQCWVNKTKQVFQCNNL